MPTTSSSSSSSSSSSPSSFSNSGGRLPAHRSKSISHPPAPPAIHYQTSNSPSPFPHSSSHPLKHSSTVPTSQSSNNLRTNVLRSRTVLDAPSSRSGFIDSGTGKEVEAKVVLLGTQSVGKTTFIHRYTKREWMGSSNPTISANISTRKNYVNGVKVKLQIWDTAGGERFRGMVNDITNRQTFHDLKDWIKELKDKTQTDTIIHVVGSKSDLRPTAGEEAVEFVLSLSRVFRSRRASVSFVAR
ncbi:P-loop containing nucleoside triphosphate hydrolase protein [Mrakia frigida]|uniref:Rab family GTPase n=1 Tax=Mrakia frigida TaxID=29902 RepID=UPI003FCC1067